MKKKTAFLQNKNLYYRFFHTCKISNISSNCQRVSVTSHQLWTPCPRILPGLPLTTQNFICFSVCYLPVFTYLQIPKPTLLSSAPGSQTPHEPAQKPNISIQLRIIELDFLLDSHPPCSKRSPLAPHVNKLACLSLTCCLQLDL